MIKAGSLHLCLECRSRSGPLNQHSDRESTVSDMMSYISRKLFSQRNSLSFSTCLKTLINTFPQALVSTCLQYKTFENTAGKGEIARNEQFHLSPRCFLPVWKTFCHFHETQNCRLPTLSVWKSLQFVVQETVKSYSVNRDLGFTLVECRARSACTYVQSDLTL